MDAGRHLVRRLSAPARHRFDQASPKLTIFETTHAPDFTQQIEQLKTAEGWQSTELGHGYVLLRVPS